MKTIILVAFDRFYIMFMMNVADKFDKAQVYILFFIYFSFIK
jgi:hypothetical protein